MCGTFLPPLVQPMSAGARKGGFRKYPTFTQRCSVCPDGGKIEEIMIPHVYKYLIAEMGSVNLRVCMKPRAV